MAAKTTQYVARLLDGAGNTIHEVELPGPYAIENWVREWGESVPIVDDERYEGSGNFVSGSIEWFVRDD